MVCWQERVPIADARRHAAVRCGRRPSRPHRLYVTGRGRAVGVGVSGF